MTQRALSCVRERLTASRGCVNDVAIGPPAGIRPRHCREMVPERTISTPIPESIPRIGRSRVDLVHDHPLVAPAAMPSMMNRWAQRKIRISGRTTKHVPAITTP